MHNTHPARLYLWLIILLISSAPLYSQDEACLHRKITGSVTTLDGRAVAGLTSLNFRIEVARKSISVNSVDHRPGPVRVGILLDVSADMRKKKGGWRAATLSARQVVAHLPEGTHTFLITFSDRVEQKWLFDERRTEFFGTLNPLSPSGRKASKEGVLNAIREGLRVLGSPQFGDVLFIVTAAEKGLSNAEQQLIEQQLSSTRVRLFGFSLDRPAYAVLLRNAAGAFNISDSGKWADLERLAYSSGGVWFRFKASRRKGYDISPSEGVPLLSAARELGSLMFNTYEVDLQLPRTWSKPQDMRITLVTGAGQPIQTLSRFFPVKLYPCIEAKP